MGERSLGGVVGGEVGWLISKRGSLGEDGNTGKESACGLL